MKKSLHVVLSCTNRKRVSLASYPRLREVTGDAEERVERWTAWIDSTVLATTTADLYLGEFWRLGLSLARSASAAFDTQLWVLSAGLGLINGDDGACAYGATFSSGHPDSVVGADRIGRSTETRRAWWNALSAWSGAGRAGRPRSLTELAAGDPSASILVCAGPSYIDAVEPDLVAALDALADPLRMAIFGSKTAPAGLEESWVFVPGRLRMALGGSLASTGPRAARAAVETHRPGDHLDASRTRALIGAMAASAPAMPAIDRKRLTDEDVTTWITTRLIAYPETTKSPALRALRDAGLACEQSRFGRLFDEASRRRRS